MTDDDATPPAGRSLPRTAVGERSSKRGYRLIFTPGAPPDSPDPDASPSSVTAWACTAVSDRPSFGFQHFCIDSSGVLCTTLGESPPVVTAEAQCDVDTCTPVR